MDHLFRRDRLVATLESPGKNRVSRLTRRKSILPIGFTFPSGITNVNVFGSSYSSSDRLGSEFTGSQFRTFNRLPGESLILGINGTIPEDIPFGETTSQVYNTVSHWKVLPVDNEFVVTAGTDVQIFNHDTLVLDRTIDFTSEFTRLGLGGGFVDDTEFTTPNDKVFCFIGATVDSGLTNETRLVEIDITNEVLIPTVIILDGTKTNYFPTRVNAADEVVLQGRAHISRTKNNIWFFNVDTEATPETFVSIKSTAITTTISPATTFVTQSIVATTITLPSEINNTGEMAYPLFTGLFYENGTAAQHHSSQFNVNTTTQTGDSFFSNFRQVYIYDDTTNTIVQTLPVALKSLDGGATTNWPFPTTGTNAIYQRTSALAKRIGYVFTTKGYYYISGQNRTTGEITIGYTNLVTEGSNQSFTVQLNPSRDSMDNQTNINNLPIDIQLLPNGESCIVGLVWASNTTNLTPSSLPNNAITSYTLKPNGITLVHRFTNFFPLSHQLTLLLTAQDNVFQGVERTVVRGVESYEDLLLAYTSNIGTVRFVIRDDLNPDENFDGDNIELSIEWVE